jgi:maltose O-acetyltransferase
MLFKIVIKAFAIPLLKLLPAFRFFSLRRFLLNINGHRISCSAKICGPITIYGRGILIVGDNAWIGPNCKLYISENFLVEIERNCDIAPEITFVTGSHVISSMERRAGNGTNGNILIKEGSWLGINTTVLGGCCVGPRAVIGASSLLLQTTYPGPYIYGGLPAKILKPR